MCDLSALGEGVGGSYTRGPNFVSRNIVLLHGESLAGG